MCMFCVTIRAPAALGTKLNAKRQAELREARESGAQGSYLLRFIFIGAGKEETA